MAVNKYGARRTYVEAIGRTFASKREADAALVLWARQQAGEVRDLAFQVSYDFYFDGEKLGRYVADFVYDERWPQRDTSMGEAWVRVVADAKGVKTPVYRIKKRLMRAFYGIDIKEI